eukprot:CAMPEP_0184478414 /NCGR_PEP_ID=MMETSP0113_2-20130426/448_1 /TAXON_ID=91329 /ORGANISM="Norrisiella sphaerica, Strain BC52" /LENGTH=594 /DNA_ID=CAMNT_0026856197 /DNA_START=217 /DNA_END=1998 /DNA_ORIENTATION=+
MSEAPEDKNRRGDCKQSFADKVPRPKEVAGSVIKAMLLFGVVCTGSGGLGVGPYAPWLCCIVMLWLLFMLRAEIKSVLVRLQITPPIHAWKPRPRMAFGFERITLLKTEFKDRWLLVADNPHRPLGSRFDVKKEFKPLLFSSPSTSAINVELGIRPKSADGWENTEFREGWPHYVVVENQMPWANKSCEKLVLTVDPHGNAGFLRRGAAPESHQTFLIFSIGEPTASGDRTVALLTRHGYFVNKHMLKHSRAFGIPISDWRNLLKTYSAQLLSKAQHVFATAVARLSRGINACYTTLGAIGRPSCGKKKSQRLLPFTLKMMMFLGAWCVLFLVLVGSHLHYRPHPGSLVIKREDLKPPRFETVALHRKHTEHHTSKTAKKQHPFEDTTHDLMSRVKALEDRNADLEHKYADLLFTLQSMLHDSKQQEERLRIQSLNNHDRLQELTRKLKNMKKASSDFSAAPQEHEIAAYQKMKKSLQKVIKKAEKMPQQIAKKVLKETEKNLFKVSQEVQRNLQSVKKEVERTAAKVHKGAEKLMKKADHELRNLQMTVKDAKHARKHLEKAASKIRGSIEKIFSRGGKSFIPENLFSNIKSW